MMIVLLSMMLLIFVIDDLYDKGLLLDKVCVCSFNVLLNVQNVDVYVVVLGIDIMMVSLMMVGVVYQNVVLVMIQDLVYLNGGIYQVVVMMVGSKLLIFKIVLVNIGNNVDWLLLMILLGGVGDVMLNDIYVFVVQGNDVDMFVQEFGLQ